LRATGFALRASAGTLQHAHVVFIDAHK